MNSCRTYRLPPKRAYRILRPPAILAFCLWLGLPVQSAGALDCTDASDGASLATAIAAVNAGSCDTINITGDITLAGQDLPIIDRSGATVVIRGSGGQRSVDGTGTSRLFAVLNGNVTLSDIDIANGLAKGGAGGSDNGGGGGAGGALGAGGGVFVGAGASVTLENVDLSGNTAQGGDGGDATDTTFFGGGAGGGGLNGGDGGSDSTSSKTGGKGGGGGFGADGASLPAAGSQAGGGGGGGGNDATPGSASGGSNAGGAGGTGDSGNGGSGSSGNSGNDGSAGTGLGGGGGSGGSGQPGKVVGDGGAGGALGGGGGGGGASGPTPNTGTGGDGGSGGFGGGGGGGGQTIESAAGTWSGGDGGLGGFGAGGGGGGGTYAVGSATAVASAGGAGGFLGGDGGGGGANTTTNTGGGGGGGAGLGGAIFVQNGGTLNIGENVSFGGGGANTVAGGTGGSAGPDAVDGEDGGDGAAAGANIYAIDGTAGLGSNATVGFQVGAAQLRTLADADLGLLQSGYSSQLRKTGAGELSLQSSTGMTTGGWTINEGTLRGDTGNLVGDIVADGTLAFDQAGNGTYAGQISGGGAVLLDGGGTVTFTGDNDAFTGSVQIDGGTLSVNGSGIGNTSSVTVAGGAALSIGASGETVGSLAGAGSVILGGSLVAGGNNGSTEFSGVLSGSGGLTKTGSGILTLSGTNSYTGGTTIDAGTLIGNTLSLTDDILNEGALVFDQPVDGSYGGQISGSGGLAKSGNGQLLLSGNNSYTGPTTVNAGALSVNGSLASEVAVATGGTLKGSGSVGSATVHGLLAPGNSIGTLTVNGDLTLSPSSEFEVEFDANGNADKAVVTGTANLDGTLRLAPGAGTYANGTDYVILQAGTVTGQFANTTVTDEIRLGGLSVTVTITADEVLLALSQASFGGGSGSGSGPVADYIDRIRPGLSGGLQQDIGVLEVLPAAEVDAALDALSPQVADAVPQVQLAFGRALTDAMEVRLEQLRLADRRDAVRPEAGLAAQLVDGAVFGPDAEGLARDTHSIGSLDLPEAGSWEDDLMALAALDDQSAGLAEFGDHDHTVWVQLLGEFGTKAGDDDLLGYDYRVFGITSGIERRLTPALDLGVLFAIGHSDVDFDENRGANTALTYSAGAYLGWTPAPNFTIDLMGWGGLSRLDGERNIQFTGMDRQAESETDIYSLGVNLRAAYGESFGDFRLGGFSGAGFLSNWQGGYCEKGAGALNLCVDATTTQQVSGEVGVSAGYDVALAQGSLAIDVELAATANLPLDDRMTRSGFVGETDSFLIPGDDEKELGLSPRIGLSYQMDSGAELSLSYQGQFSDSLTAHGIQAGLRISF